MELYEVMRTTFAAREYTGDPLPDAVLHEILENARFAPSGGNRQGNRVIVVRDPDTRGCLAELAEPAAKRYSAQVEAGESPWNTIVPTKVTAEEIETLGAELATGEQALASLEADRASWVEAHERREELDVQLARHHADLYEAQRAEDLAARRDATQDRYERLRRASELVAQGNQRVSALRRLDPRHPGRRQNVPLGDRPVSQQPKRRPGEMDPALRLGDTSGYGLLAHVDHPCIPGRAQVGEFIGHRSRPPGPAGPAGSPRGCSR